MNKTEVLAKLNGLKGLLGGWDGYRADPIDIGIIEYAKRFVASLPDDVIPTPIVTPMAGGRLQLEWHKGERSLECEFEDSTLIHYLKWDSVQGVEEEDSVPLSDEGKLLEVLRWF